jgi:hypothetical protein
VAAVGRGVAADPEPGGLELAFAGDVSDDLAEVVKFNFSRTTIPCGTVTFVVTNTGQLTHSLEITAPAGAPTIATQPPIQPGQTQTFTATMTAKGIYPWQCGEREDNSDDGEYGNLLVQ